MPSLQVAREWNRSLRWFRFVFAHGGPANDFDTLSATVLFDGSERGLLASMDLLGVVLDEVSAPRRSHPDLGPIPAFPAYRRPGKLLIHGAAAFLNIGQGAIEISLAGAKGNDWDVVVEDFDGAAHLERVLPSAGIVFCPRVSFEAIDRFLHGLTERNLCEEGAEACGAPHLLQALRSDLGGELLNESLWRDANLYAANVRALARRLHEDAVLERTPGLDESVARAFVRRLRGGA